MKNNYKLHNKETSLVSDLQLSPLHLHRFAVSSNLIGYAKSDIDPLPPTPAPGNPDSLSALPSADTDPIARQPP